MWAVAPPGNERLTALAATMRGFINGAVEPFIEGTPLDLGHRIVFDTNQPGLFFANAKGHPWSAAGDWLMIRDVVMMAVMVALFLALTVRRAN